MSVGDPAAKRQIPFGSGRHSGHVWRSKSPCDRGLGIVDKSGDRRVPSDTGVGIVDKSGDRRVPSDTGVGIVDMSFDRRAPFDTG